jgi:probable addiction module antidote protein
MKLGLIIRGFETNPVTQKPQSVGKRLPREVTLDGERNSDRDIFRDNAAAIAKHLTDAFATNDLSLVVAAINTVMRAQNVLALAEATGLRRDLLYKTFGGEVNPQLGRVMELFAGLDVRLVVKPLKPKEKPPRPKLGRPPKVNETPS